VIHDDQYLFQFSSQQNAPRHKMITQAWKARMTAVSGWTRGGSLSQWTAHVDVRADEDAFHAQLDVLTLSQ